MTTLQSLLEWSQPYLKEIAENPQREAQQLLAFVLNCAKSKLYAWPEQEVAKDKVALYRALIQRRSQGEPMAYLLGEREFWSLPFKVNRHTLIPRHETELLVEQALLQIPQQEALILELGTGSGAISCALASERPQWKITATDISEEALNIAKYNANALKLNNISFVHSNWLQAFKAQNRFDAIISNPPYIEESSPYLKQKELAFEPISAFVAGEQGLNAYIEILKNAKSYLRSKGIILFEHGYQQDISLQNLLLAAGFSNIKTVVDLANLPRVTSGIA